MVESAYLCNRQHLNMTRVCQKICVWNLTLHLDFLRQYSFIEIGNGINFMAILPLPRIQVGQLSVTGRKDVN